MVWTLNSGRARGGPHNSQQIHHHGPEFRIAFAGDVKEWRPLHAQQGPTEKEPNVMFGSYIYQPALEEWWWDSSSVSSSRVRPETVK
jgi:hypothetical protein